MALAAGELCDLCLLMGAGESERRAIGAAGHLAPAEIDPRVAAGNLLPYRLVGCERVARLVDIAKFPRLADPEAALVRLLLADDHAEERGLAGAVGADDADDAARWQAERQLLDEPPVAIGLGDMLRLDDEIAEARPRGPHDLRRFRRLLAAGGDAALIGAEPRLRPAPTRR